MVRGAAVEVTRLASDRPGSVLLHRDGLMLDA